MYVFRMRDYANGTPENPNCPPHKLEASTEHRAASFAHLDTDWIYFFVDLTAPEAL